MFMPNPEVDAIREQYKKEYDDKFNEIRASVKGSPEHKALLKQEMKLHLRTGKFMRDNAQYFRMKRDEFWKKLKDKDAYGDAPDFRQQDARIRSRDANRNINDNDILSDNFLVDSGRIG